MDNTKYFRKVVKMANEIMDISPNERKLLSYIRKRPPMYIGEYFIQIS